ncbi:MAG: hypothetical protein HY399_09055 [Elusimicrobia bacterium]|nr:hypothetical protein [Elusimicrobiota bacterium]
MPFGHYNELYRPDQFLAVTRPLLYASPDSLDLVVRLNSPRAVLSSGYTDIGARINYYPHKEHPWILTELTAYVINGLGEVSNRQRTFPSPSSLLVPPPPIEGVSIDFGHQNNNLADNNNNKTAGGRISFALGDLRIPLPIPIPESRRELKGVNFGLSAMDGRYDLEQGQDYFILGVDARFQYLDFSINAEYIYSDTDFKSPQADTNTVVNTPLSTSNMPSSIEINRGFYVQAVFPVMRKMPVGDKLLGILVYNRMERRGPRLVFSSNTQFGANGNLPVAAFPVQSERISTQITKYTAALNYQWSRNFIIKGEYSYWDISVPPVAGVSQTSINQSAFSMVFSF